MTDALTRTRRNIVILVAAQAILGAQMSVIFIIGGLAGQILAPNPCLATLPLSMIILGSALSARPLARFMQMRGRRAGFLLAVCAGGLGAAIAAAGLWSGSFLLFMAGSLLTGIYMSAQGFYRFAVTDTAPDDLAPRAAFHLSPRHSIKKIDPPPLNPRIGNVQRVRPEIELTFGVIA